MAANLTSRTYDCWDAVFQMLRELFPDPAISVEFADEGRTTTREAVIIAGITSDPAEVQDWAALGQGARDERFGILIAVIAEKPGQNANQAKTRLRDFTDAIESALRTTWRQLGGVNGVVWAGCQSVLPRVAAGDEGWFGYAEVWVFVRCRI